MEIQFLKTNEMLPEVMKTNPVEMKITPMNKNTKRFFYISLFFNNCEIYLR